MKTISWKTMLTALALVVLAGSTARPLTALEDKDADLVLYVDSVKGDDANDGLSAAKPFKTLTAAQMRLNKLPAAGKAVVNLARGSVWRESYPGKPGDRVLPMVLKACGEGPKPVISGMDLLPNAAFKQNDPENYPNVWFQRVTPPPSHAGSGNEKLRLGMIVGGDRPLWRTYTPYGEPQRDFQDGKQEGIATHEDALAFINSHKGSFYARDNGDGSFDYFVNSGSDPTKDKLSYEYKVRGPFFSVPAGGRWENIRFVGQNTRNAINGRFPAVLKGVDILYGDTHNMLKISAGHYEGVLSVGYRTEQDGRRGNGNTATAFHTYSENAGSLVYDRCTARNSNIGFFDHHLKANRPLVILRDCVTENVDSLLGHGVSTKKSYIVGHRHNGVEGQDSRFSSLAAEENYIEDSTFRLQGRPSWHPGASHLRMRNSVVYTPGGSLPIFMGRGVNYEYDQVTLILDFQGREIKGDTSRLAGYTSVEESQREDKPLSKWKMKNSVIAVINAPNMKTSADGKGVAMIFGTLPAEFSFENCVLTFIGDVPESAGTVGKDYVFAAPGDIFAGDPGKGDYTLKPGGVADKKDTGYKAGRKPVYRPIADKLAVEVIGQLP